MFRFVCQAISVSVGGFASTHTKQATHAQAATNGGCRLRDRARKTHNSHHYVCCATLTISDPRWYGSSLPKRPTHPHKDLYSAVYKMITLVKTSSTPMRTFVCHHRVLVFLVRWYTGAGVERKCSLWSTSEKLIAFSE